jgi:cell division protein FtsQ
VVKSKKVDNLLKIRKRKIFARRLWMAMRVFLIVILFAGAVWGINYFYNSNYFKISKINIEGNIHYDDEYIGDLLESLKGSNIFEIDKKKIEDSIIDNMVWIKSVELKKIFPDNINIFLEERKPLLIINYKNKYYLIDREAVVLEEIDTGQFDAYKDLLIVAGAIKHSLDPGDVIAKKNILSCADIYRGFDGELKNIIKEAGIEDNIYGDIFFMTHDGLKIIFGDSNEIIKKIEVLKLLLKEEANYIIINLKSPDNPVVKY